MDIHTSERSGSVGVAFGYSSQLRGTVYIEANEVTFKTLGDKGHMGACSGVAYKAMENQIDANISTLSSEHTGRQTYAGGVMGYVGYYYTLKKQFITVFFDHLSIMNWGTECATGAVIGFTGFTKRGAVVASLKANNITLITRHTPYAIRQRH